MRLRTRPTAGTVTGGADRQNGSRPTEALFESLDPASPEGSLPSELVTCLK